MRAAEVEPDEHKATGPVLRVRKPDRLAAAVAYFSGVDDAAPAREAGGVDGLDPSEVKVPTRRAVLAPSVGFAVRFLDGFVVVVPPAPVGRVDGCEAAPESVSVADREDGPTDKGIKFDAAGGFAACEDDDGAPPVSELDLPPSPFVSNSGPVPSPSRISTERFLASSNAVSRSTSNTHPRLWWPSGIFSPCRRASARTLNIVGSLGCAAPLGVRSPQRPAIVRATSLTHFPCAIR